MLPIAETFHSIQGEGVYVGTPMHFIRLAGCTVGKLVSPSAPGSELPSLPSGLPAWTCKAHDGRAFFCDTDFKKYAELSAEQLIQDTHERHICLTGGEPLMHQNRDEFKRLIELAYEAGIMVHIETSGTILLDNIHSHWIWLTVAPKYGFLEVMIRKANEVKLLVDENFSMETVPDCIRSHGNVFLQPINYVTTQNNDNVALIMGLLKDKPRWRLGVQLHKLLGVR